MSHNEDDYLAKAFDALAILALIARESCEQRSLIKQLTQRLRELQPKEEEKAAGV